MSNVADLFFQTAERLPKQIAIVDTDGKTLTYADFAAQVNATAAYFRRKGLKRGDRVLVVVPMSLDLYRVVMAIFQAGATAVFLDEWVSMDRLKVCCQLADCQAFIADWKLRFVGFFVKEVRQIPLKLSLSTPSVKIGNLGFEVEKTTDSDSALITFTTGSTGIPKAADRTHGFLKHQFDALIEKMQPKDGDVVMTTLPIVLLVNFGTGATSVVAKFNSKKLHLVKPDKILQIIENQQVKTLIASPFFVKKIAEHAATITNHQSPITKVFTGGAPVFPDEAALYLAAFPNVDSQIVFGSTEAEPISSVSATILAKENDLILRGGLNVGTVYHKTNLRIIPILDREIDGSELANLVLLNGKIGEIIVAGDHVLKQYFRNDAAFKKNKIVESDGTVWHRTGDAGFQSVDNQLFLTGRCNQMIQIKNPKSKIKNPKSNWVSPFLVEGSLQKIDGIEMATILERNEKLIVIAEKSKNTEGVILEEKIRAALPYPIAEIQFIAKMPRDPRHHSKIDYGKLVAIIYET